MTTFEVGDVVRFIGAANTAFRTAGGGRGVVGIVTDKGPADMLCVRFFHVRPLPGYADWTTTVENLEKITPTDA